MIDGSSMSADKNLLASTQDHASEPAPMSGAQTSMYKLWEFAKAGNAFLKAVYKKEKNLPPNVSFVSATGDKPNFGIIKNVAFVTPIDPDAPLDGDDRLIIDLGAKLARGMNLAPRYVKELDADVDVQSPDTLYIAINCSVFRPDLPTKYPRHSVAISNDLSYFARNHKTDFRFEPSFDYPAYKHAPLQRAFRIDTLPSRVTPEVIAEAASKYDELRTDGEPLIAIMLKEQSLEHIQKASRIARTLSDKHGAHFILCDGPFVDQQLHLHFEDIPGTRIYPWGQTPNPYLALLGAATHLVTSGSLSTTSDLLATGKPVYYMECDGVSKPSGFNSNGYLRKQLFQRKAVQFFSEKMLDIPPPDQSIRTRYAQEWDRVGLEFAGAIANLIQVNTAPHVPHFGSELAHRHVTYG